MNDDCYKIIILMLADMGPQMFKSAMFTCKTFAKHLGYDPRGHLAIYYDRVDRYAVHVESIVRKYGEDAILTTHSICVNMTEWMLDHINYENLPRELILRSKYFPVERVLGQGAHIHQAVNDCPAATMDIIRKYPDCGWNRPRLIATGRFTFKMFKENLDFWWPMLVIGEVPHDVDHTNIMQFADKPWNILFVGETLEFSWKIITDIVVRCDGFDQMAWGILAGHRHITMKIVDANPGKPWVRAMLDVNPNMSLDVIKKSTVPLVVATSLFGRQLNDEEVDYFAGIGMRDYLVKNPTLTIAMALRIGVFDSDVRIVYSTNRGVSIRDIIKHSHLSWSWEAVSMRADVTLEMVMDNRDLPWVWPTVLGNVHLSTNTFMRLERLSVEMYHAVLSNASITLQIYDMLQDDYPVRRVYRFWNDVD